MGVVLRDVAKRLDDDPLLLLERFHGHLGPYVVLGYRMGRYAKRSLAVNPFSLRAEVFTGPSPPVSCLVDGIQVGSCCTLGKGNVKMNDGGRAEVLFITKDGRNLRLRAKPWVIDQIASKVSEENIIEYSERIYSEPDENLFEVVKA